MTTRGAPELATTVLRVLLDRRDSPRPARAPEAPWDEWAAVLQRNAVLLRVAEHVDLRSHAGFAAAVLDERARVARVLQLMRHVALACEHHGIPYVFPKALAHYPDAGSDIDLLVPVAPDGDRLILGGTLVAPGGIGLAHLLSATRVYRIWDTGLVLDIHHGRVGQLGEHRELAARLIASRRRVTAADVAWWASAPEDALVLQGLDRVAGRRSFRLGDVVSTIRTVRAGLDWDAVLRTARAVGGLPSLWCYLSYVAQISREALGRELALPPLGMAAATRWGRAEFKGGLFRFPAVRVSGAVYASAFGAALAAGRWAGAGRLLLLPVLAAATLGRRAARTVAAGAQLAVAWAAPRSHR
jgi:hypothetical protein